MRGPRRKDPLLFAWAARRRYERIKALVEMEEGKHPTVFEFSETSQCKIVTMTFVQVNLGRLFFVAECIFSDVWLARGPEALLVANND